MYIVYSPELNQFYITDQEFLNSSLYIYSMNKLITLEYIGRL